MVGLAAICWAMCNICFERKRIRSPTEIICSISSFISYWAELQQEEDKKTLEAGAEILKTTALHLHPHQASPADVRLVLLQ